MKEFLEIFSKEELIKALTETYFSLKKSPLEEILDTLYHTKQNNIEVDRAIMRNRIKDEVDTKLTKLKVAHEVAMEKLKEEQENE